MAGNFASLVQINPSMLVFFSSYVLIGICMLLYKKIIVPIVYKAGTIAVILCHIRKN